MLNYVGTTSLLVIFFINQMNCCFYDTDFSRMSCISLVQVSAEGNDTWSNLIVTHTKGKVLTIKENSFQRTPNLRVLSITDVTSIHNGAFNGLEKLDKLAIFSSKLTAIIPKDAFDNLPIRDLQILNCEMKQISVGLFDDLAEVRMVDFRKNHLKELKAGVFNNTPIYKLYLDTNRLETIEDNTFIDMEYLIYLSLSNNKLKSFESKRVLGTSKSVSQIWLNKNQLTTITTKVINSVPNLEKVYFEINMIDSIEEGSFNKVPFIDFIDLSNNHLSEFPPRIFPATGLKHLFYFFLHNNRLTFINKSLFIRAPGLRYMTFGGNPLQCSCLDELNSIATSRNISRPCDNVYYSGERPTCITGDKLNECLYDVELTKDLFERFSKAIADYPKLEPKCDTTKGIDKIALANIP